MAVATPGTQLEFIDLPDLRETFVDSVRAVRFDGMTIRADLCVTRAAERTGDTQPISVQRYPACRLVLTPEAAVDLYNRLQHFIAAMEQRGILKRERRPAADALQNPLGSDPKQTT
jgi:hypothetical protein